MKSLAKEIEYKHYSGAYFQGEYSICRGEYKRARLIINKERQVLFQCPSYVTEEKVHAWVYQKEKWIQKQLQSFPIVTISNKKQDDFMGEEVYFLGKKYKIIIHENCKVSNIERMDNMFHIRCKSKNQAQKVYRTWLKKQGSFIFHQCYEEVKHKFDYAVFPNLSFRKMKSRWGSYIYKNGADKILLNSNLIQHSEECIRYVLIHELCHKKERNHTKKFYDLLSNKLENWQKVKKILNQLE